MSKNRFNRIVLVFWGITIFINPMIPGCSSSDNINPSYIQEVEQWHARRIASLRKPNSWLSLAGLFWLKEGKNSFGGSEANRIKFPSDKVPQEMGWFILDEGKVSIQIRDDISVYHNGNKISNIILKSDSEGDPDMLSYGSLNWYIIKRGERYGVRLKDNQSSLLKNFTGIERYSIDPKWKVTATFQAYDSLRMIEIPNVLGTISEDPSPGKLILTLNGQSYSLDPIANPDDKRWFIIFSDETSGEETYGAGRFLYIDAPDEDGMATIDFNKAYNPPCAFTPYATCPLPPVQNHLAVRVTAGEKKFQGYEH